MKSLLAKELRQVLPAHALLALLFTVGWRLVVSPDDAVVPHAGDLGERHRLLAMVYLAEGLVLGFALFGMERWNRTR